MNIDKNIELLYERFLHTAQYILWSEEAAKSVTRKAIKVVREKHKKIPPEKSLLKWAQSILDDEIEVYFQELLKEIKANSKSAETELFKILSERFLYLVNNKISRDTVYIGKENAEDIVQNAIKTVYEKCKISPPKSKFIQWAQQILKNKYWECRKKIIRNEITTESISQEEYEPIYTKKIGDIIKKRRSEKPMDQESPSLKYSNSLGREPFEEDPYDWQPIVLLECKDLKKRLLSLVKKMSERCRRVFKILFSGGDSKALYKEFPELTEAQVHVVTSRCRSQLKAKAIEGGIL